MALELPGPFRAARPCFLSAPASLLRPTAAHAFGHDGVNENLAAGSGSRTPLPP